MINHYVGSGAGSHFKIGCNDCFVTSMTLASLFRFPTETGDVVNPQIYPVLLTKNIDRVFVALSIEDSLDTNASGTHFIPVQFLDLYFVR